MVTMVLKVATDFHDVCVTYVTAMLEETFTAVGMIMNYCDILHMYIFLYSTQMECKRR